MRNTYTVGLELNDNAIPVYLHKYASSQVQEAKLKTR